MTDTQLAAAIADVALLRGDFLLRSGRRSSYYLDKYLFSTRPYLLDQLGDRFAQRIRELDSADAASTARLAGAELGGIPLVTVASLKTGLPSVFIRNAKKDYGTAKRMEGVIQPGERVLLIEDVVTSGGQSVEAATVLRDAGAVVPAVIAVIDRQEGAAEALADQGLRLVSLFTKSELGVND